MNLSITRALKMPVAGPNWYVKVLIGAALCFVAALANNYGVVGNIVHALIGLFTLGYTVRVMGGEANTAAGSLPAALPTWDDPLSLAKDGLIVTVANTVYGLLATALIFAVSAVFGVTATVAAAVSAGSLPAVGTVGLAWFVIVGVIGFVFALVVPTLTVHYANTQRITALIDVPTAFRKLASKPLNVLVAIVGCVVVGILSMLLAVTIVGAPFAAFLAPVVVGNIWAQIYRLA